MLSIKFVPQDRRNPTGNLDGAMRCSAEDAAAVASLFKLHPFNTRVFQLPALESADGLTLGRRLERMLDSPSPVEGELEPGGIPKVVIDQKVLLEVACLTALSTRHEVKSMLGASLDRDALEISISHCGLVPRQIVSPATVDPTVRYSAWLTKMESLTGDDRQVCYGRFHGDYHSHVSSIASPSDIDLQGAACLADGRHGDMEVEAGTSWQKWWVGLIGNLQGDLYVFLVDTESGRFYSDLPWEVKPTVTDPELWVRSHLGFVLDEMGWSIANRDVPRDSSVWERCAWIPESAAEAAPATQPETASPHVETEPAANAPAEPIRRPRRGRAKLTALAAALLLFVGAGGLYYEYGNLLFPGESSAIALQANPAETKVTPPVGTPPASEPLPAPQIGTAPTPPPATVAAVTTPPASEPQPAVTPPKPEKPVEVVAVTPVELQPLPPETASPAEPVKLVKLDEAAPVPTAPKPAPTAAMPPVAMDPTPEVLPAPKPDEPQKNAEKLAEAPVAPTAPQPAPVAEATAKVEKAPVVKPEASQPKPAIAPMREPWQDEIVRRNKGIHKADRAPKELDLRAFEGIDPGRFRDWTAEEWWDWTLMGTTTMDDRMAVPEVIRRAFDEQVGAKKAAEICKACTSDLPTDVCKGLNRKKVRQYCDLAPEYRGKNYKPLQLLPVVNSTAR